MPTLAAVQSSCAFASPDPLDRAIQRELATWATVEADHRSACRWLDEWCAPEGVKEDLACRLEARHRTEREADLLRLADLHQQRAALPIAATLAGGAVSPSAVTSVETSCVRNWEQSPGQRPSGIASLGIG